MSKSGYCVYPFPRIYTELFLFEGLRYIKTSLSPNYLVSDFDKNTILPKFLPPIGKGSFRSIPAGDYKKIKALYDLAKKKYSDEIEGNLNKGVKTQITLSF